MNEKIKQYFNQIFAEAPKTRKALDLKQEMMQSAIDKYNDMVADGYSEEDAYQYVIDSIGDVTELFVEVEEKSLYPLSEKDRKKKAILTSVSVGLYLFAAAVLFFFTSISEIPGFRNVDPAAFAFVPTVLLCIPPTVMLVYVANMYPDSKRREKTDMVEQYKEILHHNNKQRILIKSINPIIWSLTVVLYVIISFTSNRWEITWVIFLIAVCVQQIIKLILSLRMEESA